MSRLGEVARVFLKLGTIGFGGPAAHVAMMRDEVVVRRAWVSDQEFLDALGATSVIPGPGSTQMAISLVTGFGVMELEGVRARVPPGGRRRGDHAGGRRRGAAPRRRRMSARDPLVLATATAASVAGACALGDRVAATGLPDADHGNVLTAASAALLRWVDDRLAGIPAPSTCTEGSARTRAVRPVAGTPLPPEWVGRRVESGGRTWRREWCSRR